MTRDEIMAMTPAELKAKIGLAMGGKNLWIPNNISQAWDFVKEMPWPAVNKIKRYDEFEWVCYYDHYDPDCLPVYDDCETYAICRAWLLWKTRNEPK